MMVGQEEENVLEIQKSYSEEIIKEIQNAINSESAKIKILSKSEELPNKLYISGVSIQFLKTTMYDACLHVEETLDKSAMLLWKTEPAFAFLYKDWKRLNRDVNIFENNNYIEINFKVKDANVVALLRRIDIDLSGDPSLKMSYGDIYYNVGHYSIVKAFVPNLNENYWSTSILENNNKPIEKMYDNSGREIIFSATGLAKNDDEDGEISMVGLNEAIEMESEELF